MKTRELQAMAKAHQVRASCNILTEMTFFSPLVICTTPRKIFFMGFAQSVLKNVESHSVTSAL